MKFKVRRYTKRTLTLDDGAEVELEFDPYDEDDIVAQRVGNSLVVAYNVHDSDPACNPLKDYDCQGDLYTLSPRYGRDSTITDNDAEVYSALGLYGYGDLDLDRDVTLDGRTKSLREFAAEQLKTRLDHDDWCELLLWCHKHYLSMELSEVELAELKSGECSKQRRVHLVSVHEAYLMDDLMDDSGRFSERLVDAAKDIYAARWRDIVGPYVVPVSVHHNSYDSRYYTTTWDGDIDDLPNGVWVACGCAKANIGVGNRKGITIDYDRERHGAKGWVVRDDGTEVKFFPIEAGTANAAYLDAQAYVDETYGDRPMDIYTGAEAYAKGVLEEYSNWCSGEVYGCVVQIFDLKGDPGDPVWEPRLDWDSCWGFIGYEYAKEALLDDFVEPAIKRLQDEQLSAVESEGGLTD